MLLCIDIGNTNIKIGLFEAEALQLYWTIATDRKRSASEYAMLLLELFASEGVDKRQVTGCAISSVVPSLTQAFQELVEHHLQLKSLVVGQGVRTGMRVNTDYPAEVGSDLITSAVAARHLYGAPVVVVGLGTATTLSAVSASGDFEGVAIAPGVITSAEALFQFAAALPQVVLQLPPDVIGKNTIHSMQAGLVLGFAALVEGLAKRMRDQLGGTAQIVATGGLAPLIAPEAHIVDVVEPNLVLIGLRLIYDLNRAQP